MARRTLIFKRKPSKSFIKEQIVREIRYKIKRKMKELNTLNNTLMQALTQQYKVKISDYKKYDWYIDIEFKNGESEHIFVNKETGENRYEKNA